MTRYCIPVQRGRETIRLAVPHIPAGTPRAIRVRVFELTLTGRALDAQALLEDPIRWDRDTDGPDETAAHLISQRPHAA